MSSIVTLLVFCVWVVVKISKVFKVKLEGDHTASAKGAKRDKSIPRTPQELLVELEKQPKRQLKREIKRQHTTDPLFLEEEALKEEGKSVFSNRVNSSFRKNKEKVATEMQEAEETERSLAHALLMTGGEDSLRRAMLLKEILDSKY